MEITAEARRSLDEQHVRLAGAELPSGIDARTRAVLQQAINESFVFGFRTVMMTAAGLGPVPSWSLLIENK